MNRKLVIAAAAAVLVGGPIVASLYSTDVAAQAIVRSERQLTPPEAAQVAQRMNLTVDEAVRQGLMEELANGNYLVTESGAALLAANGVPISAFAGATPLQITGMVALALGLTVIGESLVDEDVPVQPGPTATPTVAPTATPTATVAPTATPTATATATATATVVPTATPTATAAPTATPTATATVPPTPPPTPTPTAAPTVAPTPVVTPTNPPSGSASATGTTT